LLEDERLLRMNIEDKLPYCQKVAKCELIKHKTESKQIILSSEEVARSNRKTNQNKLNEPNNQTKPNKKQAS